MEERIVQIVKAVAIGPLAYDDVDAYCAFCSGLEESISLSDDIANVQHATGCPVILARAVLKEQDTPVNVYKITYEHESKRKTAMWTQEEVYTMAVTVEDAIKAYTWEKTRNVQATFVRELPLQG